MKWQYLQKQGGMNWVQEWTKVKVQLRHLLTTLWTDFNCTLTYAPFVSSLHFLHYTWWKLSLFHSVWIKSDYFLWVKYTAVHGTKAAAQLTALHVRKVLRFWRICFWESESSSALGRKLETHLFSNQCLHRQPSLCLFFCQCVPLSSVIETPPVCATRLAFPWMFWALYKLTTIIIITFIINLFLFFFFFLPHFTRKTIVKQAVTEHQNWSMTDFHISTAVRPLYDNVKWFSSSLALTSMMFTSLPIHFCCLT